MVFFQVKVQRRRRTTAAAAAAVAAGFSRGRPAGPRATRSSLDNVYPINSGIMGNGQFSASGDSSNYVALYVSVYPTLRVPYASLEGTKGPPGESDGRKRDGEASGGKRRTEFSAFFVSSVSFFRIVRVLEGCD